MKNILIFLGAGLVILLESLFLCRVQISGVRPDYLFIVVFLLAFHRPIDKSILLVWLIGLLKDMASQNGFGTSAFLYLISALVISFARQIVFNEDIIIQMTILFISALICNLLNGLGVFLYYSQSGPPLAYIMVKSIYIALYTAILIGIILIVYKQVAWYWRLRASRF